MEWYKDGMYPEWHLSGTNFSPKELQNEYPELILTNSNEKTDQGLIGRFKGKEYGFGSTKIVVAENVVCKFDWLLDFVLKNAVKIREQGVDDEIIWIYWYGIQGNMEIDKNMIEKMALIELDMAMNYIYIE